MTSIRFVPIAQDGGTAEKMGALPEMAKEVGAATVRFTSRVRCHSDCASLRVGTISCSFIGEMKTCVVLNPKAGSIEDVDALVARIRRIPNV